MARKVVPHPYVAECKDKHLERLIIFPYFEVMSYLERLKSALGKAANRGQFSRS